MSVFALIHFKSHHGATKYEGNPWPYWAEMALLMPSNVKKAHMYLPAQLKLKCTWKKATAPAPAPSLSLAPVPTANSTAGGSNDANVTMKDATPSWTGSTNPNFITPLTPSMFLSPLSQPVTSTSSSTITSVSCYDWPLRGYLFSPMLLLPSYVSFRTLSVFGGPVCFLSWSPILFSCTLSSGCPYPCSLTTIPFLSGVGFITDHNYVHCLYDPCGQTYLL